MSGESRCYLSAVSYGGKPKLSVVIRKDCSDHNSHTHTVLLKEFGVLQLFYPVTIYYLLY